MKTSYYHTLKEGVLWGLSSQRPAWQRTVNAINHSRGSYRVQQLEEKKNQLVSMIDTILETWFAPIYDCAPDKKNIFDLQMAPEQVWKHLVTINSGIFDKSVGGDPLIAFLVTLPSKNPGEGPLYLSLNIDGWGVTKR